MKNFKYILYGLLILLLCNISFATTTQEIDKIYMHLSGYTPTINGSVLYTNDMVNKDFISATLDNYDTTSSVNIKIENAYNSAVYDQMMLDTTVKIENTNTTADTQSMINEYPKNLGGHSLTFTFGTNKVTQTESIRVNNFYGGTIQFINTNSYDIPSIGEQSTNFNTEGNCSFIVTNNEATVVFQGMGWSFADFTSFTNIIYTRKNNIVKFLWCDFKLKSDISLGNTHAILSEDDMELIVDKCYFSLNGKTYGAVKVINGMAFIVESHDHSGYGVSATNLICSDRSFVISADENVDQSECSVLNGGKIFSSWEL